MAHRGPDGEGFWRGPGPNGSTVQLAHRRLAIIDLSSGGEQPMADTSGRFTLTFNGEIYNYLELRTELQGLGVRFRTASDSEVLLEAYKVWGENCLHHLNGMFAFCIFDSVKGALFAARDRFGEKPLLYAAKAQMFAFASEYKSLLSIPGVGLDFDERRLIKAAYNPSFGLDVERQTVFNDVRQLLPGERLRLDLASFSLSVERWYEPKVRQWGEIADPRPVFDEFRELLTDSIRLRLRSDVPVGSCLSGGLDSSSIVCLSRELLGEEAEYHTFTGQFPGTYADEAEHAAQIVAATGVRNHLIEPTAERFVDDLDDFVWANELPVASSSQFAQWCVFRRAKEERITVLLDGQGADEMLGGYGGYFRLYAEAMKASGKTEQLEREMPLIKERYPNVFQTATTSWRDRMPLRARSYLANALGKGTNLLYGVKPHLARELEQETQPLRASERNVLSANLERDSFGGFLTTLLRYGDRNSMAHSREVRLPFCDHRLSEFSLGLPPEILMGDAQNKRLLRESMRGVVPEPIRARWTKQGFRPPQDLWFRSPRFLNTVRDYMDSSSLSRSGLWNPRTWSQMITRVEAGELELGWTLWHPFMIEAWRRGFVDRLRDQVQLHNAA